MVDPTQIIWNYLTESGSTLYGLVGTRVWSPRAPVGWVNDSAAVIYEMITEDVHVTAGDCNCRVQFSCYGGDGENGNPDTARAVYKALYDKLHGVIGASVTGGQISYARLTDGAPGEREQETEWEYARAIYEMRVTT